MKLRARYFRLLALSLVMLGANGCLGLLASFGTEPEPEPEPECVENSGCRTDDGFFCELGFCVFDPGFGEVGDSCEDSYECDLEGGLLCDNGLCKIAREVDNDDCPGALGGFEVQTAELVLFDAVGTVTVDTRIVVDETCITGDVIGFGLSIELDPAELPALLNADEFLLRTNRLGDMGIDFIAEIVADNGDGSFDIEFDNCWANVFGMPLDEFALQLVTPDGASNIVCVDVDLP